MKRMFGAKKAAPPPPDFGAVTGRMDARTGQIEQVIAKCEADLNQVKRQMAQAKSPAQKQQLRQRAAQIIKRRNMYQAQLDQQMNVAFNVEQVAFAYDTAKDTMDTVNIMKQGAAALKAQNATMNVDDVYKIQDDLQEALDDAQEIQEVMSRAYDSPAYDDFEIEAELDALGDTMGDDIYDMLPSVPKATGAAAPGAKAANPLMM